MTPDARIAIAFLAELAGGLSRAPLPVPGSEECYSGIDVPTRVVEAAVRALKQEGEWLRIKDPSMPHADPDLDTPRPPASGLNVPERAPECRHGFNGACPICGPGPFEAAGESVGVIAVTAPDGSADKQPAASPSRGENNNDQGGGKPLRCPDNPLAAPPPPVDLGLETPEEEWRRWKARGRLDLVNDADADIEPYGWTRFAALLRDHDRLAAEVARLTGDVTYWQECFMSGNPAREALDALNDALDAIRARTT